MSAKRLQVLLDEDEFQVVRDEASRHGMTVSDWVRHALRHTSRREAEGVVEDKLAVIDHALQHEHPTGDIDEVLAEIEQGYLGG